MNKDNERWRDNCKACPFFDKCNSTKSAEECKSFLNKKMIEQMKSILKNSKAE